MADRLAKAWSIPRPLLGPATSGARRGLKAAGVAVALIALSVSADMLLFAHDERGPGEDLKLQFEAANRLDPEEKNVIRSVIESIVLRNTVKAAERRFADNGGSTR